MFVSTQNQREYIASLMHQNYGEYPTLDAIFDATPKNNDKYPNVKCNYQQLILADNLKPLTISQAGIIIAWFKGDTYPGGKKIRTKVIFEILTKINLVK